MSFEDFLRSSSLGDSGASLLGLGIAAIAGILSSAVCPCTLPVGLGLAGAAGASETNEKKSGLKIALVFFAGIVACLTLLGALASRLGAVLTLSFGRYWTLAMAVVSLIAAVVAFYGPRLTATQLAALRKPGLVGTFTYGFIFSLGTSAAPLLVLLTIAASRADVTSSMLLGFAFGVGRGSPFLLAGIFGGLITRLAALSTWRRALQWFSGAALLFVSAYYFRAFVWLM